MKATIKNMQLAKEYGFKVKVTGFAQDGRTKQPKRIQTEVTKVGKTCFYSGSKRYRVFFNSELCSMVVCK